MDRHASTCFAENQLLRNLISLSPLSAFHPITLPRKMVQPSTWNYSRIHLNTLRSFRFVSYNANSWIAFAPAPSLELTSLTLYTRRPIMQKVRSHPLGLLLLFSFEFQFYFNPRLGSLSSFRSRYLVHYRSLTTIILWRRSSSSVTFITLPTHYTCR